MTYDITLYFATGYDTINIPVSPATLQNAARSTKTYPGNYLVQNTDFTSITIADTFDNIKDADYCRIGTDRYYAVTGINMLSDATAELTLQMDYILSMGGIYDNNFRYFGATATRITPLHPSTDYNYLSEPVSPAFPLDTTTQNAGFPAHGQDANLIGMTVDLEQLDNIDIIDAVKFGSEQTEAGQVPALPTVTNPTQIWHGQNYVLLPGEKLYSFTTPDTAQLKALRDIQSLGIADAIVDRYNLPSEWGTILTRSSTSETPEYWTRDIQTVEHSTTVNLPVINGYVPVNAKVNALYAQIMIVSNISGDMHSYHWGEVETPGNHSTAGISAFADPTPNGAPFCGPTYYNGAVQAGVMQKVKGARWYRPQLVMQGSSGSAIRSYEAANRQEDLQREWTWKMADYDRAKSDRTTGMILGGALAGTQFLTGNVTGALRTAGGLVENINPMKWRDEKIQRGRDTETYLDRRNDIATATSMANNIFTPTYKSAEGDTLSLLFPNNFRILTATLSAADAQVLDRYLTKFGYAVPGEQITQSDLSRGRYFTYVQAGEIQFGDSPSAPRYIRNGAIAQLLGGVRIWKRKPDVSLYNVSNEVV